MEAKRIKVKMPAQWMHLTAHDGKNQGARIGHTERARVGGAASIDTAPTEKQESDGTAAAVHVREERT